MLDFIITFWATPVTTVGQLLFSIATTVYTLIDIQLEERDLVRHFGDQYREYHHDIYADSTTAKAVIAEVC